MDYADLEQTVLSKYYETLNKDGVKVVVGVENGKKIFHLPHAIFNLAKDNYLDFTGHVLGVDSNGLDEKSIAAIEELIPSIIEDCYKDQNELYESYAAKVQFPIDYKFIIYRDRINNIAQQYNLYVEICKQYGFEPQELYTSKTLGAKKQ